MMKAGSIWGGVCISGAIGQLEETKAMTSGQMNKKEYAVNTTKKYYRWCRGYGWN